MACGYYGKESEREIYLCREPPLEMIAEPPEHVDAKPGRDLVRGMAWVGSLRWVGQAISWTTTLAVTRLLAPTDYGIVGMAMVFINFAQMFADFGIGSTVIAKQELDETEIQELNAASILLGAAGFLLALASAWPLSRFYGVSLVGPVMAALAFVLLINGALAVPIARLAKNIDYAGMATADLLRSVVAGLTALSLALSGAGVWALVGGQLLGASVCVLFAYYRAPTSVRRPHSAGFRDALHYSKETMFGRLAWMVYEGAPPVIGGRLLGAAPLGEYTFASFLASTPGEKLVNVVTQVAQPVMARHQTDSITLHRLLSRIVEFVAFLAWPLLAGMALVAHPAIALVFNSKWAGAADPLRLLSLYNMSVAVFAPFSYVLLVTGAAKQLRHIAVLGAIVLPGFFWLGASFAGATGLAAAWAVAVPLFGVPYMIYLRRRIGFGFSDFVRALQAPALATVGMSAVVVAVLALPLRTDLERVVYASIAGAVTFTAIAALTRGRALWDFISTLRRSSS
ncbi:MAG TPA: lipopolysaccharide biosynthesis protein [Pyrinomonadaceae bacterium]|nr:lipopolysaccharide biosynthesis protein [Pyrinomonadaceae bacterium]